MYYVQNIKYLSRIRKVRQNDLAEALDVHPSAISNYLTGRNAIDVEKLTIIAKMLNVSLDDLVYHDLEAESRIPAQIPKEQVSEPDIPYNNEKERNLYDIRDLVEKVLELESKIKTLQT